MKIKREMDMMPKSLLICGILSSLLYIGMNIFIAMQWEEYNSASQTVSELSAIGAPTRRVWVVWGTVYTLLFLAFGWGVLIVTRQNRYLRKVGYLVIAYAIVSLCWPFAPMHTREALAAGQGSTTDTMHIILAMATVLLMMLMLGFGAAALGKPFRLYSILSMVILILFGSLTGMDSPLMAKNLPTPYIGVWERINIGVFLLWVVVLAIILLKTELPLQKEKSGQIIRYTQ